MFSLTFLNVVEAKEYTVWVDPKDMPKTIAEELSKAGIVMVGIGCTKRGVID